MARKARNSHIFATKSIPKQSGASKKRKRNSPSTMTPTVEPACCIIEPDKNMDNHMSTNSSSKSSSGHESPAISTIPPMSLPTLAVSPGPDFASTVYTEGLRSDSIGSSSSKGTSDTQTSINDMVDIETEDSYEQSFLTSSEACIGSREQGNTRSLRSHHTQRATTVSNPIGSSIMFNSLFGVSEDSLLATIPFVQQQQRKRTRPVDLDQPEQVPAYLTSTHALWFSNPDNKLVRGVAMGVSRTVVELQREGRTETHV